MARHETGDCLDALDERLQAFALVRDWERFHSPKNLVMALAGECGELIEHFQWLTETESLALPASQRHEVALEMADILIYLIRCAQRLDINLIGAAWEKIAINEQRYPAQQVFGKALRARDLTSDDTPEAKNS
ncbi:MAG: nucleotide pyrophosphohydrolase [Pseudomonadota bacterium]